MLQEGVAEAPRGAGTGSRRHGRRRRETRGSDSREEDRRLLQLGQRAQYYETRWKRTLTNEVNKGQTFSSPYEHDHVYSTVPSALGRSSTNRTIRGARTSNAGSDQPRGAPSAEQFLTRHVQRSRQRRTRYAFCTRPMAAHGTLCIRSLCMNGLWRKTKPRQPLG